jgi:hypothetical protein
VAVLFVSVLHFLAEEDEPHDVVAYLRSVLPAGSYLALSHAERQPEIAEAVKLYQETLGRGFPRSRAEVARFFDGWELVDPGLVPIADWRPETADVPIAMRDLPFLGGVASKGGAV